MAQLAGSVAEMSSYHHGEVGARAHCALKKSRQISVSRDRPLCRLTTRWAALCEEVEREKPALFVMDLGGHLL